MIDGSIFWPEAQRVRFLLASNAIVAALIYGTGAWIERGIEDASEHRPYIPDEAGRRWLLDGSGDVA